jgi:glutamate-1-semialdehyde 2,1-aminomutase
MQPMNDKTSQSEILFERAKRITPGGVNSPVRAFSTVSGHPRFIRSAKGAYLTDADGKQYADYVGSWGPMILGHAHPAVIQAVQTVAQYGLSFGAPTELEIKLAERISELMPNLEQVRFVNSGTEATMTAIRLARAHTQREKIIKFSGGYHGHADAFLVSAGSGAASLGKPSSPGVTQATSKNTITANYNNIDSIKLIFESSNDNIAAVIVEPIAGNMNMIKPQPGFLQQLRLLCDQYGALLIFDEVMTGFRVSLGGAQELYQVKPDLTTLGKIIGGGMPVGAIGGPRHIMEQLAPCGPVYQAGTLSGNPVAMAAGLATLNRLNQNSYDTLNQLSEQLTQGLKSAANDVNIPLSTTYAGGMFGLVFSNAEPICNLTDINNSQQSLFKPFFNHLLNNGHYFAPSLYEAGFISLAHTPQIIETTINCAHKFFTRIKEKQPLN